MTFDAAAAGTSAQAWREAGVHAAAPVLDIGAVHRLVVVAAHPDDETLMAGGLIHAVAASGRPVELVVATLGEASHPDSPTVTRERLAALRAQELQAAAAALAPAARVTLLRLADGGLTRAGDRLQDALRGILRRGDAVVAPWREDGHPDHAAVGRAAAAVAADLDVVLLEAPIWAWHWGRPGDAWPGAVRFDLADGDSAAKARATLLHRSQVRPLSAEPGDEVLLTPAVLEHFSGGSELFFPSGSVPVDFDEMYAVSDDPWGFADRWYERRKRALTAAALPRERYGRVLEIGASIGLLAAELADRAEAVLATDTAPRAVALATRRFAGDARVRVEQRRLPQEWPEGGFDLVVLSETGFYLSRTELAMLADRITASLLPDGHVLLCHWRPHVVGLELAGDEVHRVLRDRLGLTAVVRHVEDDFLLEVLAADPDDSVARRTGLR